MTMNEAATSETAEAPDNQVIPTEVQQSSTEPVPEARALSEGVRPGPTDAPGGAVTAAVAQDSNPEAEARPELPSEGRSLGTGGIRPALDDGVGCDVTPAVAQDTNPEAEARPELPSEGQSLGTEGITPALEDGAVDPMEAQYKAARLKQARDHVLEAENACQHQRICGGDVAADVSPDQSGQHRRGGQKSTGAKAPHSGPPASAAQAPDSAKTQPPKPTGPRTEAGKRRSSRNALKHGIYSKAVPVEGESAIEFNALLKGLRKHLRPQGTLEHVLIEKLAVLHWCLRRLLGYNYKTILNSKEYVPSRFETRNTCGGSTKTVRDSLDFWIRYQSTLERDIDRTLAQLFRLQEARRG